MRRNALAIGLGRILFIAVAVVCGVLPLAARADYNPPATNVPTNTVTMPPLGPGTATADSTQALQPMASSPAPSAAPSTVPSGFAAIPAATPGVFETMVGQSLHLSNMRAAAYDIGTKCLAAFVGLMVVVCAFMAIVQVRELHQYIADVAFRFVQALGFVLLMALFANICMLAASLACKSAIFISTGAPVQLASWGSQGTCTDMNFTSILLYGIQEAWGVLSAHIGPVPLVMVPGMNFVVTIGALMIFFGFMYIGLENFAITIELLVVSAIEPVFLMFAIFDPLKDLSAGAKTYPVSVVTRYFFNWLFLGIGISAVATVEAVNQGFPSIPALMEAMMAVNAWCFLLFRMNRIAKTMMDGQSRFNAMQEFIKPAMDAAKLALQVASAIATSGATAAASATATATEGVQMLGPGTGGGNITPVEGGGPPSTGPGGGGPWGGGPDMGGPGFSGLGGGIGDYGDDPMRGIEATTPPPALTGAAAERRVEANGAQAYLMLPPPPPPISAASALGGAPNATPTEHASPIGQHRASEVAASLPPSALQPASPIGSNAVGSALPAAPDAIDAAFTSLPDAAAVPAAEAGASGPTAESIGASPSMSASSGPALDSIGATASRLASGGPSMESIAASTPASGRFAAVEGSRVQEASARRFGSAKTEAGELRPASLGSAPLEMSSETIVGGGDRGALSSDSASPTLMGEHSPSGASFTGDVAAPQLQDVQTMPQLAGTISGAPGISGFSSRAAEAVGSRSASSETYVSAGHQIGGGGASVSSAGSPSADRGFSADAPIDAQYRSVPESVGRAPDADAVIQLPPARPRERLSLGADGQNIADRLRVEFGARTGDSQRGVETATSSLADRFETIAERIGDAKDYAEQAAADLTTAGVGVTGPRI